MYNNELACVQPDLGALTWKGGGGRRLHAGYNELAHLRHNINLWSGRGRCSVNFVSTLTYYQMFSSLILDHQKRYV